MLTLGLAFLAGLLTIVSPCTLPIVPALVGSAFGPGRNARIAGLLVGFGGTFLLITVLLAAAFAQAGLSLGPLRTASALVLGGIGLALLFTPLGNAVERALGPVAGLATRWLPVQEAESRWRAGMTGFAVGTLLGLVWAPCVGPLMAGVIASALVAGPTINATLVAVAYIAGTASALAFVILAASTLRRGAARAGARLRPVAGAGMVLIGVLVLTGLDAQVGIGLTIQPDAGQVSLLGSDAPERGSGGTNTVMLKDYGLAPELAGITAWINSDPTTLSALRGKVVLVHFWTFGCSNCRAVQPYVKDWYSRFGGPEFTVIGVHTPELAFERDLGNVRAAVVSADVRFPVAFDPAFATWNSYGNHYWPAFYFVDRRGHIRYVHFGEGNYAEAEQVIRELIAEPA